MKQEDIDKRIKELTEEAKELEKQKDLLTLLDECYYYGHIPELTESHTEFGKLESVIIGCTRCGAYVNNNQIHGWRLDPDTLVSDFYEVEDKEPIENPPLKLEVKEKPPAPDSPVDTADVDTKGFYRVTLGGDNE